jgi:nucleoside-diphosphate-sugar epimerase
MMVANKRVLVTGANGFIAASVIEVLLESGYTVRGTVRGMKKAEGLIDALARFSDRLEIVEVSDITAANAFDDAVKGKTIFS